MFSRISGSLVARHAESITVDVNGLAYDVVVPPCVAEKLPDELGTTVSLEIHSVLSIDGNSGRFVHYGFTNGIEREFFEALITVASIGPRSAARAFSAPMSNIARAIDSGNHAYLKKLPGIGQQKARDIVAKLQGRVAKFLLIQSPAPPAARALPDFADEALAVLLQLEYRRPEAEAMIRDTIGASPGIEDAEALLAEIYRRKASNEPV